MSIKQSRRHEVIKNLVRTEGRNAVSDLLCITPLRGFSFSFVFSAVSILKASFVIEACLRPEVAL